MSKFLNDSTMRAILGLLITVGFFSTVFFVLVYPVPSTVRDIVLVLLGALIASFKEVTGFFFGSSSGAVQANATLASQAIAPVTAPVVTIDSTVPVKVTDVGPDSSPAK